MLHRTHTAINGRSDIGQVRNENEDSINWYKHPSLPFSFLVIADGMGGYNGGALASQTAISVIEAELINLVSTTFFHCSPDQQAMILQTKLNQAIVAANSAILEKKKINPEFQHMGTTVVCAVIWQQHLLIGHIGDSRAYLWDKTGLRRLTRDDSVVQQMIDSGSLTEETARTCKVRNQLTKALGVDHSVTPTLNLFSINHDCILMLCSDGLTEYVTDASIEQLLANYRPALECCYRFINDANNAGGKDNISVGIAEISHAPQALTSELY
ncbi:Protein phosphatase PrpC [Sinobacterium norvegicum]|uniref:Protein phosphatase PrpC n=1 Tax=Sinobacterium norvegicum TaxID=1641715 RepID=A0ABM9AAI7_9GAMM|nr:Stp1/IreP family PP2C-type Ser/Thr phosphatase [Sinobacterium norvegicum]CAH0990152.1 Protein phosphatase PrpC [Sinobacterium norvegicum]